MVHLLILFLFSAFSWGNPFSSFIVPTNKPAPYFHEIKRPFAYPFQKSEEVATGVLDIQRMESELGENLLAQVQGMYQGFHFDRKTSVYAYPFALHPEWEILPYPYVGKGQAVTPARWVPEFRSLPKQGEGVRSYAFHEELDQLTQSKAYAGNKTKLLRTPENTEMIYQQLEQAKNHIFISSFLFQCDLGMGTFLDLLERKIEQGVEVYLIYDKKFSLTNPKCKKQLRKIGVQVALHRGGSPFHVFHEKMMVFDGKYGVVLGQNMLASQVLSTGTNNLINDMAVGVEGPVVGSIAERFIHLWQTESKQKMNPTLLVYYKNLNEENEKYSQPEQVQGALSSGKGLCRLVIQTPGKRERNISNLYFKTIEETKSYLFFNMIDVAFRRPDGKRINEKFLREVINKANTTQNLRVDMLTNNWKLPTDVETSNGQGISQNLFSRMSVALGRIVTKRPHREIPRTLDTLRAVVKTQDFHWWSYSQYMHGKTLMSDNIFSLIGSYNINSTSESSSYEQVLACLDTDLAKEFQESIVLDQLNSIPMPL